MLKYTPPTSTAANAYIADFDTENEITIGAMAAPDREFKDANGGLVELQYADHGFGGPAAL